MNEVAEINQSNVPAPSGMFSLAPKSLDEALRFADLLAPGGWLYIGHSETILDQKTVFRLRGPTIYQKGT